jgi:hypothetical protein
MKRKRPTRAERAERAQAKLDAQRSGEQQPAWASVQECTLSRVSEEAARAASSALAMVDTAERLFDRDLETSDDAGVAASRE